MRLGREFSWFAAQHYSASYAGSPDRSWRSTYATASLDTSETSIFTSYNNRVPDIAILLSASVHKMSTVVPQIPPRLAPNEHALPPKSSLYGNEGHSNSSIKLSPLVSQQVSAYSRPQSAPTRVKQSLGGTPRSGSPIRHDERHYSSLTKKSHRQSATGESAKVGASVANGDSNGSPRLRNNKPLSRSPCGKKTYTSEYWRGRHEHDCAACRNANSETKSSVHVARSPTSALEQHSVTDPGKRREFDAVDERMEGIVRKPASLYREAHEGVVGGHDNTSAPHVDDDDPDEFRTSSLSMEDSCDSEGVLVPDFASLDMDTAKMHHKLRVEFERELTPQDSKGYIYVLSDLERPGLHKIGRSTGTIARMDQLRRQCGRTLSLIENVPVDHCIRTEGLIQTYLLDLCRPYRCEACSQRHTEWFEISAELAKAAVRRWAYYMTQEAPYDSRSRQLCSFAKDLVTRQEHVLVDLNKPENARKHWDRIMSPTSLDRFCFKFCFAWNFFWEFCWQINTVTAWAVAFIASRHPAAFLFMAASVISTFVSISDENHRLRNGTKRSKRKSI